MKQMVTIAGYMTQMCCDSTALQAFHRGYAVNFLSDTTGARWMSNTAGRISDSDLHSSIRVTQQKQFSRVQKTEIGFGGCEGWFLLSCSGMEVQIEMLGPDLCPVERSGPIW